MDAEQNVVDNRGKRETVEDLVGAIPQLGGIVETWKPYGESEVFGEAGAKLIEKRGGRTALVVTWKRGNRYVDGPNLMVSTKKKHFVMEHDLLGEEVGKQLQAEGTAIDVVAEEEKSAGSEVNAERPQCAGECEEVGQVAVEVSKNIGRGFEL